MNLYYGKKVIVLLDEYDTPMQEAYVNGYWEEVVSFTRSLFNATFKNNPYLERAIMTGITRVSKESIFSDLNNLKVVTTTSDEYGTVFGFIEKEVRLMFEKMIDDWFLLYTTDYNTFIKALLQDNKKAMNTYMNRVALATFSNFDTGRKPSGETEPESRIRKYGFAFEGKKVLIG